MPNSIIPCLHVRAAFSGEASGLRSYGYPMRATNPPTLVKLIASCYVGLPIGTAGMVVNQDGKELPLAEFSPEVESLVRFEEDGSVRQILDSNLEVVTP